MENKYKLLTQIAKNKAKAEAQHIKKHTKKENTYDHSCPFCNKSLLN